MLAPFAAGGAEVVAAAEADSAHVNVFLSAVEKVILGFPEITEYRVLLKCAGAVNEMELETEGTEGVKARVQKALQTAFTLRVPVRVVAPGSLPRSEMRAKRWVKEA